MSKHMPRDPEEIYHDYFTFITREVLACGEGGEATTDGIERFRQESERHTEEIAEQLSGLPEDVQVAIMYVLARETSGVLQVIANHARKLAKFVREHEEQHC